MAPNEFLWSDWCISLFLSLLIVNFHVTEKFFLPPYSLMIWLLLKPVDMVSSVLCSLLGTAPLTSSQVCATQLVAWHPTTDPIQWSRGDSLIQTRTIRSFPRIFRLSAQRFETIKRKVRMLILWYLPCLLLWVKERQRRLMFKWRKKCATEQK